MVSQPLLSCFVSCPIAVIIFAWSRRKWYNLRARKDVRDFLVLQKKKKNWGPENVNGILANTAGFFLAKIGLRCKNACHQVAVGSRAALAP
jgi:hypothetical protein